MGPPTQLRVKKRLARAGDAYTVLEADGGQWRDSGPEMGPPGRSRTSMRMMWNQSPECKAGSGQGLGWLSQQRSSLESLNAVLMCMTFPLGLPISYLSTLRVGY